jgi:hypothetical protein
MHPRWKQSAAAVRSAERRQREDEAPRLSQEVPELVSLSLEIEERSEGIGLIQQKHVRRVVVDSAPALFLLPCGDPKCDQGGHDVTQSIMRALRAHNVEFEGEDGCNGSLGAGICRRILHYQGFAKYRS